MPDSQRYTKTTCCHWGARGFCIVLVVNALLGSALVMYGEQEKCKEVYRSIRKSETPNYFRSFAFYLYICKVTQKRNAMKQRLTAKEEEIMNIFWEHGEMFIRDILNYLPEPKPSYNTVGTQVKFLEEKGFVKRKPVANTFLYIPAISEKEYSGETIGNVIKQYYNNSYASVVSQFVEEEKMDLYELKALIAEIEERNRR